MTDTDINRAVEEAAPEVFYRIRETWLRTGLTTFYGLFETPEDAQDEIDAGSSGVWALNGDIVDVVKVTVFIDPVPPVTKFKPTIVPNPTLDRFGGTSVELWAQQPIAY